MRYILMTALCFSALLGLTACNTVAGVGEDISGAARWGKDKMDGN